MKMDDLRAALLIAEARAKNVSMRDRLASGETLTLTIGEGAMAGAVVLTPSYLAGIRADIVAALDQRIAENDDALRARGVEP